MIGNAKVIINYLLNQDKEKIFELKEKKDKRSLTQNAYYWSLVNQVALALKLPPEHIHFDMIKNYALSELIVVKSEIDVSRVFKYYEKERETIINDVNFTIYKVYVGSSKMSKKEFSLLLDGIIQECNQLDIPTITKEKLEKLKYIGEKYD